MQRDYEVEELVHTYLVHAVTTSNVVKNKYFLLVKDNKFHKYLHVNTHTYPHVNAVGHFIY